METNPKFQEQMEKSTKTLGAMLDYLGLEAEIKPEQKNDAVLLMLSSADAGRIIGRQGQTLECLELLINRMMFKNDNEFPRIFIDIDGYTKKGGKPSGKRFAGSEGGEGEGDGGGERSFRRGGDRPFRGGRGDRRGPRDDRRGPRDDRRGGGRPYRDEEGGGDDAGKEEILKQQALDAAKEVKRWGEPVTLPPMNAHDRRIIHITLQDDQELKTESHGDSNLKSVSISIRGEGDQSQPQSPDQM